MACRVYFCPATRKLPARWKRILRAAADHWHTYGLLITEEKLLRAVFVQVEDRVQAPVALPGNGAWPQIRPVVQRLFSLKTDWPHRHPRRPTPCNYFFEDGAYPDPPVTYPAGSSRSRHHDLFQALQSGFESRSAVESAEERIDALIEEIARALRPAPFTGQKP